MTNAKKKNEIHPEVSNYPIFHTGVESFMKTVEENLRGEILSAHDLERIRVPTGGGLNWSLPSIDGEVSEKVFDGIILFHQCNRAYWKTGIENGSKPPDCSSIDGETGIGNPGGICEDCPNALYGSSTKAKSNRQACRQAKLVYLLLPESYLPMVLVLPPSGLKPFKQFILRLSANNVASSEVIVSFGLEKTNNRSKIAYSVATFSVKEQLTEDEKQIIASYADRLKTQGTFDQQIFNASDFNGNGNGKTEEKS